MAVVKETLEVCGSILQIVAKIGDFKEDWFTLPAEYQSQAEILSSKLKFYGEQITIHGQPADSTMMQSLVKAQSTLQKAESRRSKLEEKVDSGPCCFPGWWLYAKLSMSLCPEKLEKVFKKLIEEIDNIPKTLRDEAEIAALMKQADQRRPNPTSILNNDGLYVPIEKSQSAVMKAIENFDDPSIILLHGGVGKGKSTLARYINERYGESGDVEKRNLFQHVILVPCSNTGPDPSTKQFEILEHLSPDSLGTSELQEERIGAKSRIAKALRDFLNGKKILMILDDVSDARFLYEMWKATKGTKNVRYLVTSQSSSVCGSLKNESSLIPMEDPTKDEARMILASLVGLAGKVIPAELQVIAEKMIEATEGNPLALACLASNFTYSRDNQDKRAWQDAYKELRILLDNQEDKIVLGHSDYAPRSLWAAMKMCLDSLETRDAKAILFLLYACKGESAPEEVLRILHAHRKTSSSTFIKSSEELLMRELVKPTRRNLAPTLSMSTEKDRKDEMQMMSTIWSIRSLVKLYIEHQMANKEEVRFVIGALVGGDEEFAPELSLQRDRAHQRVAQDEAKVAITLCALYFDRGHIDPVVSHAMTQASKKSNLGDCDDSLTDLRRKAIEPIIWLLDQPEEENWSQIDICCARKVLLKYICEQELDDYNIAHLLRMVDSPVAQLAILMAISNICRLEESPMLQKANLEFICVLVNILDGTKCPTIIKSEASRALQYVCWKANRDQSPFLVATIPRALEVLANSISAPIGESDSILENVAHSFANIAYIRENFSESVKQEAREPLMAKILNKKSVLTSLLKLISQDNKPYLQEAATRALGNLAHNCPQNSLRIASEDGALAGLVKILVKDENPYLQDQAARTLRNLADKAENSLKLRIANEDGALAGIVKLLYKHGYPNLQEQAAAALSNLASSTELSLKLRIANEDGAVSGLVKLLLKDENPTLQEQAARTLRNLADKTENSLKLRIANEDGALACLVKLLYKHGYPNLQEQAAAALGNLASSTELSLKLRIANEDGAVSGLVKLLLKDENPTLQEQAARTLRNLADKTENSLKLRIANEDGALACLVKLLYKHGYPNLQKQAAAALGNLASSTELSLKLRIANEDGAVSGLVKLLLKDENPYLQDEAARTLRNLADKAENSLKLRIANEDGALAGIVKLLYKHGYPNLQEQAAAALSNLASSTELSLKLRIANEDGAVSGLVKLLLKDENPTLQEQAARTLRNLADKTENSLKLRIANEDGALACLVKLLYKHGYPNLQEQAAAALGNLASSTELSLKLRIANEDGAVSGLVKLLLKDENPTLQEQAARTLRNLAATTENSLKLRIANEDGALAGLVKLLVKDENPSLQEQAAWTLRNLTATTESSLKLRIANEDGALAALVKLLVKDENPTLQEQAARTLRNLAATTENSLELRIANEDGALAGLVKLLYKHGYPNLQEQAAAALSNLAASTETSLKLRIANEDGALGGLVKLLHDHGNPDVEWIAIKALIKIDLATGKEASLHSEMAYLGRAESYIEMALYRDALEDLDQGIDVYKSTSIVALCRRCFVKAKMRDFEGAMNDANEAVKVQGDDRSFALQERGVLKRMLGDLEGALTDLDEGLELETDDYEMLKHRGYVKFLLKDEEGARTDAQWALKIKPGRIDEYNYGTGPAFGVAPVEYLGYKLR